MKVSDALIVSLLFVAGYALGTGYVRSARHMNQLPEMPGLSRRVFGAAAMIACGRGQTTPAVPLTAGADTPDRQRLLIDFLGVRREMIACAEIPADVPVDGLDGPQRASRYLLLLTAGTWKLTGVSWSGIDRLMGLLFGVSIGLTYFIGRLAMGRIASAAVAAFFMLSPMHLTNLLDLRDYSKAPFFSASLLIAGFCVLRPRPAKAIVACAAAAGAIAGLGFGVRTDIALNLVVVLGALVAFLPGRLSETWKLRLMASFVCVATFAAAAAPILGSGASGSNLWHWALLGYAHDSDLALDVAPAPYEIGYFYSDSYVATVVDASWGRSTGSTAQVSVGFPDYSAASRRYYMLLLKTFPADALLRGWASVLRVIELPYSDTATIPAGLIPGIVNGAVAVSQRALAGAVGLGLTLAVLVVLALSLESIRLAAFICVLVAFLGAYPAIQFHPRHIFHLEILSLWLLGFAISSLGRLAARGIDLVSDLEPAGNQARRIRRPLLFAAALVAVIALPLVTLRGYQQRTAIALFSSYEASRRDPIPVAPASAGGGRVRAALAGDQVSRHARRSMWSEMLAVEIRAEGCPSVRPSLTFRYRAADPAVDFSRTYDVNRPAAGGVTTVYFPFYETGDASPNPALLAVDGLETAQSDWPCVKGVSRFAEPDAFPLLLAAVLPVNWRSLPMHQTLRRWEPISRIGVDEPHE